jgi:hypothetical protein
MRLSLSRRALAVVSLAIVILVSPMAADAAGPGSGNGEEGRTFILHRALDWISSLWGAGGPGLDPTRRPSGQSTPVEPLATGEAESPAAVRVEPLHAGDALRK